MASNAASHVLRDDAMTPTDASGEASSRERLEKVSKDFEAIFLRMIFKQMRSSVERSSLLGNSRAMEFFETMRDEQLADSLAKAGGLGIGNMIYQRLQEATVPHLRSRP
jgi:flagellar protein FlgJ